MKKILFVTLLSFVLFPGNSSAADLNCKTDLLSSVTYDDNWNDMYIIRAEDGTAWQRAIISNPRDSIILKEGEKFQVSGTADPGAEVQVFLFAPQDNGNGGVRKPGRASCFSAGKANMQSRFNLEMPSQALWDGVGGQSYVDAFFKMDQLWDQQNLNNTDKNFFIGTHNLPTIVDIEVEFEVEEGCERLCKGVEGSKGLQKAIIIDPSQWPRVENENFKEINNRSVAIGNFDHTFYAGTKEAPEAEVMAIMSLKVMTVEVLKRFLNGSLGNSKPAMDEISAVSMREAAAGSGYALDIQALAKNIKIAMTSELFSTERKTALDDIVLEFENRLGCTSGKCVMPTRDTLSEIFPPQQSETEWDDLFMDILMMWTEKPELNQCILPDEKVTEIQKGFLNQGHHHRLIVDCDWLMTYTHGYSSPAILINSTEPAELKPDFHGVRITYSDQGFSNQTGWKLDAGPKKPIFYRYESLRDIKANTIDSACIKPDQMNEFIAKIADSIELSAAEKNMINSELTGQIDLGSSQYHRFSLANPDDIKAYFSWKLNGQKANIRQLFFQIEAGACEQEKIELTYPDNFYQSPFEWDGLEVGIVQ